MASKLARIIAGLCLAAMATTATAQQSTTDNRVGANVDWCVFQGESRMVKDNLHIAEFEVPGIPPGPPGQEIDLRFTYDLNGVLEVQATVVKTQKDLKLRTSLERLANFLLREQVRAGQGAAFELSFEKRKLASLLGMTPENLSRAFRRLRRW